MHRVGVVLSRMLLLLVRLVVMVMMVMVVLVLLMVMMGDGRRINGRVILHEVQIEGVG